MLQQPLSSSQREVVRGRDSGVMRAVAGQQRKGLNTEWFRSESQGGAQSRSQGAARRGLRLHLLKHRLCCETYCVWSQDEFTFQVCPRDPTVPS